MLQTQDKEIQRDLDVHEGDAVLDSWFVLEGENLARHVSQDWSSCLLKYDAVR